MAKLPLANSDEFATIDDEDFEWAGKHIWRLHTDGHVVRLVGESKVVYLCNEVVSRYTGRPLSDFGPPKS